MDNSPEYIRMCKMGWKIIGLPDYEPKIGHYLNNKSGGLDIEIDNYGQYWYRSEFEDRIPVYTQDQSLGMIEPKKHWEDKWRNSCLLEDFDYFVNTNSPGDFGINYSMDMLAFCFLMKDKYNKIWDGEDWVESQKSS